MKSGLERALLLEQASRFYLNSDHEEEARKLLDSELMQLQSNLVPWFHIGMSDSSLCERIDQSSIRRSALHLMKDRWQRLEKDRSKLLNDLDHFTSDSRGTSPDQVMHKLAYLYSNWYSPKRGPGSIEDVSLGKGTLGIAVLFAAYHSCTEAVSMEDWIQAEVEHALELITMPGLNLGAFNGLGSVILALDILEGYGALQLNPAKAVADRRNIHLLQLWQDQPYCTV